MSRLHATEALILEPRDATAGAGWPLRFSAAREKRAQVSLTRQVEKVPGEPGRIVTTTRLGVPVPQGMTSAAALAIWAPSSRVTLDGQTLYITSTRPVISRGRLVYLEVLLGDTTDLLGGGWIVDAAITRSGRNPRGDRIPIGATFRVEGCVISLVSSDEATDLEDTTTTQAKLTLPPGTAVGSSDVVDVEGSPLAGRWQVQGVPVAGTQRVVAVLTRGGGG